MMGEEEESKDRSKEPRPQSGALKPKIQDRDPEPSSG